VTATVTDLTERRLSIAVVPGPDAIAVRSALLALARAAADDMPGQRHALAIHVMGQHPELSMDEAYRRGDELVSALWLVDDAAEQCMGGAS
jgi:hypothetical protein